MSNISFNSFGFLPTGVKNIVILNVIFFLFTYSGIGGDYGFDVERIFALHHWNSAYFRPWQIVTHMFMHGNFSHLFFNMFAVWMFGYTLENIWGLKKFFLYYLLTGVGAALFYLGIVHFEILGVLAEQGMSMQTFLSETYPAYVSQKVPTILDTPMLGASGAFYGLLAAFGLMFPNSHVYIYFLFPVKVKYFVLILGAIQLYNGFVDPQNDGIAYAAHLGGMLVGFFIIQYWKKQNTLY